MSSAHNMSKARIWKFTIPIEDEPTIDMPVGARVLSVGAQSGYLVMWALVPNTGAPTEERHFFVIGTGNPIPWNIERCPFIGTVQIGGFVGHIFDQREVE